MEEILLPLLQPNARKKNNLKTFLIWEKTLNKMFCRNESMPCENFGESCYCVQHYKVINLKVYEEFEETKTDDFYFPSQCLCERKNWNSR